ncbi:Uncharacterised protein [Serratia quinivorans]|uniref:hypothetical protein n=1 Tax=Serratia quinivorans TaxID=137545 RepID=UPI002179CFAE|nr:hypothetical protein [Serratia quinivorans]CAI1768920.1 Uncharacterised protein [Serratia quinivorans]
MNIKKQYKDMVDSYEQMAAKLMPASQDAGPETSPDKMKWAEQEGFRPMYNPNSDSVTWVKKPEPSYNVPDLLKMRASMSPETLTEVYPMFGMKAKQMNPVLLEIYQAALSGDISQQRAEELVLQMMSETYKDASKGQKVSGAGAKASSFDQTVSNASKGQKITGAAQ